MPSARTPGPTLLVVAYGGADQLRQALAGTGPRTGLVVDNSSDAAVRAASHDAGWDYHDPGANLGFATAVNTGVGLLSAGGDAPDVLLLNPDAVLLPDALDLLEQRLADDPQLAAVAPSLRSPSGRVEPTVWPVPTPGSVLRDAVGRPPHDRAVFLNGAVLLLRGRALEQVGPFDERFFLYAEECDWQVRAQRAGWRVEHVPEAWAEHVGGGTSSDPRRRLRHFHASAERYARKWHGDRGWQAWRAAAVLAACRRAVTGSAERRREQRYVLRLLLRGPVAELARAEA